MIKATRFFFFDVDTSNCKAMISMIKATRFFNHTWKRTDLQFFFHWAREKLKTGIPFFSLPLKLVVVLKTDTTDSVF